MKEYVSKVLTLQMPGKETHIKKLHVSANGFWLFNFNWKMN